MQAIEVIQPEAQESAEQIKKRKKAENREFHRIKKALGLNNAQIAKLGGFKSARSFQSSKKRDYWVGVIKEIYYRTLEAVEAASNN